MAISMSGTWQAISGSGAVLTSLPSQLLVQTVLSPPCPELWTPAKVLAMLGRATTEHRSSHWTQHLPTGRTGDSHKLNVRPLPHVLRMQSMVTPDWGRREKGGLGSMWLVLAPHLATLDGPPLRSCCRYTGNLTLRVLLEP